MATKKKGNQNYRSRARHNLHKLVFVAFCENNHKDESNDRQDQKNDNILFRCFLLVSLGLKRVFVQIEQGVGGWKRKKQKKN